MPGVYILQSESSGRFYIGCTEDPRARLSEHTRGQTRSTRGRAPWLLVYQEQFRTCSEALARERQLKSWKSHRCIQQLIDSSRVVERVPAGREGRFDPRPGSPNFFRLTSRVWCARKSTEAYRGTKGITSPQNITSPKSETHLLVGGHGWPHQWGGAYRVWRKK
jgi:putative endonuclease